MNNSKYMTPFKPHLIQSCINWIIENNLTPYLAINTENSDDKLIIPDILLNDKKQIVFNVSSDAIDQLEISSEIISFEASFEGDNFEISIPVDTVIGIYAQENLEGLFFDGREKLRNMPVSWKSSKEKDTKLKIENDNEFRVL